MLITCAYCGIKNEKRTGEVNRARNRNAPIFCNRTCAGLGRRNGKTIEQKRAEKREYDASYREKNADALKTKKHEYFVRTYNPDAARIDRKKRAAAHAEYCRRPEYQKWKRDYDRQYRAGKEYGEFAECFLLAMDIRAECLRQQSDYEIRLTKNTLNKRNHRRRDYEKSNYRTGREVIEVGSLGNLERGQRR